MTDIVERLRSHIDYDCKEEAAAEIERLQEAWYGRCVIIDERDAEIERLRLLHENAKHWEAEHLAEIERLRAALDDKGSGTLAKRKPLSKEGWFLA